MNHIADGILKNISKQKNMYNKKYIKYIHKIKQIGGDYDFITCFLWINNKLSNINQETRNRILRVVNLWKYDNPEKTIFLFFDYQYTTLEDISFFGSISEVILKNIRDLPMIRTSERISRLFEDDIPIYMRVDMAKIIIQYDLLSDSDLSVPKYIVMPDIDILSVDDQIPQQRLTCNNNTLDNFSQEMIFDSNTLQLLDFFGIIMSDNINVPENNFLIVKNDAVCLEAMKDIFIDKMMNEVIYEIIINRRNILIMNQENDIKSLPYLQSKYSLCANFIYGWYNLFFGYLNLLKGYINFKMLYNDINQQILDQIPGDNIQNKRFIIINNKHLFWFINNNNLYESQIKKGNYFFLDYRDMWLGMKFNNAIAYLTDDGFQIIQSNVGKKIYPSYYYEYLNNDEDLPKKSRQINEYPRPTKCVKLEISGVTNVELQQRLCPAYF